jgi:hypothetical protein
MLAGQHRKSFGARQKRAAGETQLDVQDGAALVAPAPPALPVEGVRSCHDADPGRRAKASRQARARAAEVAAAGGLMANSNPAISSAAMKPSTCLRFTAMAAASHAIALRRGESKLAAVEMPRCVGSVRKQACSRRKGARAAWRSSEPSRASAAPEGQAESSCSPYLQPGVVGKFALPLNARDQRARRRRERCLQHGASLALAAALALGEGADGRRRNCAEYYNVSRLHEVRQSRSRLLGAVTSNKAKTVIR